MIKGNKITLVPATLNDRRKVYEWGCKSEITKCHAGPPDYPEHPVATWEEFCDDYVDYYFDGSDLEKGRGFIITFEKEPVGFISYASFHLKEHKAELDIWMNSEAYCGKGFGTDAIIVIGDYLNKNLNINELIMRPSVKNERAIKSYMKAGFEKSDLLPGEYLLDEYLEMYGDGDYGAEWDVLLVKKFTNMGCIKKLGINDVEELRKAGSLFWSSIGDEEKLNNFLSNKNNLAYVALYGEEIVGFAFGYMLETFYSKPMLYIHSIDVAEKFKRKGFGKALMNKVIEDSKGLGAKECFLITNKSNDSAVNLYESVGGTLLSDDDIVYEWVF